MLLLGPCGALVIRLHLAGARSVESALPFGLPRFHRAQLRDAPPAGKNMVGEREAGSSGTRPARAKRSNHRMSTQTLTRTATTDTAEPVTSPVLPADNRAGDGHGWMDTLEGTPWPVLPDGASEG